MQYNSWLYLLPFLGSTVLLYYLIPVAHRWIVLLLASMTFYLLASKWFVVFVMISAMVIYLSGLWIDYEKSKFFAVRKQVDKKVRKQYKEKLKKKESLCILIVCLINTGILFFCKYSNFVGENLNLLFQKIKVPYQIPHMKLIIPLGISFYTMAAISYVVDVSRDSCKAEKNYGRLLLYLIFFPVIVEGPIERYENLGTQLKENHSFDFEKFCFGCQLIIWGLFEKVVLADRLNLFTSTIFLKHKEYHGFPIILAIIAYTFQLYMDFSGCIDIARGSAELFGIRLAENFRRPFFSRSVSEFWRRWHISLGDWFKDYIFYPVSLSKWFQKLSKKCRKHMKGHWATVIPGMIALFCVWFSTGIWHGAEWKYIIYGLYYYLLMVMGIILEPISAKLSRSFHLDHKGRIFPYLQQLRTFFLVNIGMLIFRAPNLNTAISMFKSIMQPFVFKDGFFPWLCKVGGLRKTNILMIILSIIFLIFYGHFKEKGGHFRIYLASQILPIRWMVYLGAIAAVLVFGAYGPGFGLGDFIYAQF